MQARGQDGQRQVPQQGPHRRPATRPTPVATTAAAAAAAGRTGGLPATALAVLQRTLGNRALAQLVADEGHQHGPGCGHSATPVVQRATDVDAVLSSPGRPLAGPLRQEMEARLDADFSDVRVHDDTTARQSAAQLGARAYTSGSHVVIGEGGGDKHTLAHELTHVIQQRSGPVAGADTGDGLRVSDPGDSFERAAETNAARVMSGPVPVQKRAEEETEHAETHPNGHAQRATSDVPGRQRHVQRVVYNTRAAPTRPFIRALPDGLRRTASIEMMTDGSLYGTPPAADPTGYDYIRQLGLTNFWIRFHLINQLAGGPGTQENLVPASKRDNSQYEVIVERPLKDLVDLVDATNSRLPAGSPLHYVYFGVDVHYATARSGTSQYQQSFAPYFVDSLTVHLKRYDPATGQWTSHFPGARFDFQDQQPTDLGAAVPAATITLPDLVQLTGSRRWDTGDVGFLQSIGAGGSRSAEFQGLVDHYGSTGPEESVVHTFWQMPFRPPRQGRGRGRQTGAVSFAERIDSNTRLNTLARLIATGKIGT
ncbi:DUF4157 domain-containing protein [Streptomyces sp. NPDC049687]|uniref:DUF4157 domain-containing protein n=1 Tax=Streptomyces sp. NPDC049687 TaxID=3365596 RepID=UPI0037992437